jgi:hypothetical protein
MTTHYLDPVVFDVDNNSIFELECNWNSFEDYIIRNRKLSHSSKKKLQQFYYDRFFQLIKLFPRNTCTPAYINAIHYCICSGKTFYRSLSQFKFAICEQSETRVSEAVIAKIEKIFYF